MLARAGRSSLFGNFQRVSRQNLRQQDRITYIGENNVVVLTKMRKHDLQTPTEYGKIIDVNVEYPRRNFSIISDVETDYRYFMSEITLIQHKPNENYAYGYRFDWRKLESKVNRHRVAMLLFHPSFQKVSAHIEL